jgi:hypothetical protein
MKRIHRYALVSTAVLAAMTLGSSWARAWDADLEDRPVDQPEGDVPAVARLPLAPPDGVYLVTETYVDDIVIREGPVTTYATETIDRITGSYARVLETVATGAGSGFDGAAFNGRAALTDGRAVAGTYYENYIRTEDGFVAVSIVFFQDDVEIARARREAAAVRPAAPAERTPAAPGAGPVGAGPIDVAPRGVIDPVVDEPAPRPSERPADPVVPIGPDAKVLPVPLPDRAIEVLRARRTRISFADPVDRTDGVRAAVTGWRFVAGEGIALGPVRGGAGDPFMVRWDRLAAPGSAWVLRFRLDLADGSTREQAIRVSVRAPGLVE